MTHNSRLTSCSKLQGRRCTCIVSVYVAIYESVSQYKMNSELRGRCLIINIRQFDKASIPLAPRPGADKDAGE